MYTLNFFSIGRHFWKYLYTFVAHTSPIYDNSLVYPGPKTL